MPTIAWSTLKNYLCCWKLIPSPDLQAEQWGPRERSSLAQGHEAELGKAKIGGLFHLATKWQGCNLLEGPRFRWFLGWGSCMGAQFPAFKKALSVGALLKACMD